MSGLRLVALGVGNAFSARYYSSCLAIEAEGTWLLIDCPHPIRKVLREASNTAGVPLDVDSVAAVALTHLHADHSSGLEGLGYYSRYILGRPATIVALPQVSARLWDSHLAGGMEESSDGPGTAVEVRKLDDFFHLTPLSDAGPVRVGPFTIHCRLTIHSLPTTAFRIEAGGRCLGCSADTVFDPTLIDWLSSADLIVHETGPGHMHTPYERLAELPESVRGRMRLIHYPDDFDVEASAIEPLRQGHIYQV
jgi:ribonuclease BN (tRNA processing enzyme)